MKENAPLRRIYIVPHSHHDYAWVHERQWHILRYCEIFDRVIDWLEKNPSAYWMIDNVAHSWEPFAKHYPERAERFKELVREGRIEISNGGYSLARPSYVGEETFVRNLIAGDTFFKETFGVEEIPYYHNLDTASGQQQIPQLLKLMGCRWYRFQRPEVTLDQREIPRTFYWQGLDGTKILVSRAFGGGMLDASYTNLDFSTQWEEARDRFLAEDITPRRVEGLCPSDTEMIHFGCDDSFPDTNWYDREVHLFEFIDEWNRREETKIGLSTAREYFEDLETKDLETVACGLDDSELTFNLPAKGDRSMWRKRGELEQLLTQTEGLGVIAALSGESYPEAELEKMWMQTFQITGHAMDRSPRWTSSTVR